jgi:hypothetical protein
LQSLSGGALIGLAAVLLMATMGRIMGPPECWHLNSKT